LVPLVNEYTPVDTALAQVKAKLRTGERFEVIPVLQAYGRVSAKDIVAPSDVPAFSTSHMDGFAVIAEDLKTAARSERVNLLIVDVTGPGGRSRHVLKHGEAVQVATGARLPAGADTVVPVESATVNGRTVEVGFAPELGQHVYRAGVDVHSGDIVLSEGHVIRAQDVGLLITLGFVSVAVWRKPKVSVIATGSELTPASRPKAGKVVDSHSPVLVRLAEALGCTVVDLGVVADNPGALKRTLRKALATSDLVITLGGTSAGKHDLVIDVTSKLQPEVLVHGIRADRGRVTGVATVKGKPILMVPGPIQAAVNAFFLLGIPLVETLSGRRRTGMEIPCVMGGAWEARKRFPGFQKVVYVKLKQGNQTVAEPLKGETESMRVLSEADGYMVVPEGVGKLEVGSQVRVRLIPGFSSFL